ncbi:MAG: lipoyl synthase [bacterium]
MPPIQIQKRRPERRPQWLKVRLPNSPVYSNIKGIVNSHALNTVCQEARCPNMAECWSRGTATFMILGEICTRSCGFCAVKTGRPGALDWDEPRRVAEAVEKMGVRHAVITSVNRDERKDGGAPIFAGTIREIRKRLPECTVEVLIPDFKGSEEALQIVIDAKPDILNHNVETAPRLYRTVRPQANYRQSLTLLLRAKRAGMRTKSGFMVGIGEQVDEIYDLLRDLRKHEVDIVTIGQYLQPTPKHLPVARFVHPEEFERFKEFGQELGIGHVESGPLARSSYHAEEQV